MRPKIALCTHMISSFEKVVSLARENGYTAVDYSLDSQNMGLLSHDILRIEELSRGSQLEVRYHCPFGDVEIAHADSQLAGMALSQLKAAIVYVQRAGGPARQTQAGGRYLTIHMGLNSKAHGELHWENGLRNLRELVKYGKERDVVVCLENLKTGFTSEPERFLELIEVSGAKVTFDIGHAASSLSARNGHSAARFARLVAPHIVNAHIYEEEGPGHIAPTDLTKIEGALKELVDAGCRWWVIELTDPAEVKRTQQLLNSFLNQHYSC